jgi:hypothetical protein
MAFVTRVKYIHGLKIFPVPFKDANRVRHGTAPQMVESYIAEGLWSLELKKDEYPFEKILILACWDSRRSFGLEYNRNG